MIKSWVSPWTMTPLAAVLLIACGRVETFPDYNNVQILTPPPRQDFYPSADPGWTPLPEATATPSPTPRPLPPPPATGSIFLGWVGSGVLDNQLVDPQGLAFAAGSLFVADAGRTGLLGKHGAVLRFDPTENRRQAVYETRASSTSLPVDLAGIAVATAAVGPDTVATFVYSVSPWAVFGHVADKLWSLNLGAPYAPGGVDIAVAGDRAWVAEANAVRAYKLPWWTPDDATADLEIKSVRGIALQGADLPWVAAGGKVFRGSEEFKPAAGGPVPSDPRDVAVDFRFPENYPATPAPADPSLTDPALADPAIADPAAGADPGVPTVPEYGQGWGDTNQGYGGFSRTPAARSVLVLEKDRVLRFSPSGEFLGSFGEGRIGDGRSLTLGDDGSVYVSDASTRRVYRFAPP